MSISELCTNDCKKVTPNLYLDILYRSVYVYIGSLSTWPLLIFLSRPSRRIRHITSLIFGAIGGTTMALFDHHHIHNFALTMGINVLASAVPVFLLEFWWIRVGYKLPWMQQDCTTVYDMSCFVRSIALCVTILSFFSFSELVLYVAKRNTISLSPFLLPITFVLGLNILRLIGKRAALGVADVLQKDQLHPRCAIEPNTPLLLLDIAYQEFYFIFYRKLFFTTSDFMSMAILQCNAMIMDLLSVLSVLRFSEISKNNSCVVFTLCWDRIHTQGEQLVIRQIGRFTSFISVVGFSFWFRYGYNRCFFDNFREFSNEKFWNLIGNFLVMIAWELLFLVVLCRLLKRMIGLDLIQLFKEFVQRGWVREAIVSMSAHFITDVYFGLMKYHHH